LLSVSPASCMYFLTRFSDTWPLSSFNVVYTIFVPKNTEITIQKPPTCASRYIYCTKTVYRERTSAKEIEHTSTHIHWQNVNGVDAYVYVCFMCI
jgi:hypothetical protein